MKKDEGPNPESALCDVCNSSILCPQGYLLTTREVVSSHKYWQYFYELNKSKLILAGVHSYQDFCRDPLIQEACKEKIAGQPTPWLVCHQCIPLFNVQHEKTRDYAIQWWQSKKLFHPPGTSPAPASAIKMEYPM